MPAVAEGAPVASGERTVPRHLYVDAAPVPDKDDGLFPVQRNKVIIQKMLKELPVSIFVAGTGAGKSRYIPQYAMELLKPGEKMIVSEPLVDATEQGATTIAKDLGVKLGKEVGFMRRGKVRKSEDTQLTFATEGVLLKELEADKLLSKYTIVGIDEVHQRGKKLDIILGALQRAQLLRQELMMPPLKIFLTSATVDAPKLQARFKGSKILEIPGKTYPIEPVFNTEVIEPDDAPRVCAEKIEWALKGQKRKGNFLTFLSGERRIRETKEEIKKRGLDVVILEYYSKLPESEQRRIFEINKGKTIVILATNKAEVAFTLPVQTVVDSGFVNQTQLDPVTGIVSLVETRAPRAQMGQRKGRVGRVAPEDSQVDMYISCTAEDEFNKRMEYPLPEILRSDLAPEVLQLLSMKYTKEDVYHFPFVDPPPKQAIDRAFRTLEAQGVINASGNVNEILVKFMADLSVDAHLARMIAAGVEQGCIKQTCAIAAMVEHMPRFFSSKRNLEEVLGPYKSSGSDFLAYLKMWEDYEKSGESAAWAKAHGLEKDTLKDIKNTYKDLVETMIEYNIPMSSTHDQLKISRAITVGFLDRLVEKKPDETYTLLIDNVGNITPGRYSSGRKADSEIGFGVIHEVNVRGRRREVELFHPVSEAWARELMPQITAVKPIAPELPPSQPIEVPPIRPAPERRIPVEVPRPVARKPLVDEIMAREVQIPQIEASKREIEKINKRWIEAGRSAPIDVEKYYREKLGGIKSQEEFEQAVSSGRVNLIVNPADYPLPELKSQPPPPEKKKEEPVEESPRIVAPPRPQNVAQKITGFFKGIWNFFWGRR